MTGSAVPPAGAQVPDTDSVVRIGYLANTVTLDPHKNPNPFTSQILNFYDRLTTIDLAGQKVIPMLATSWAFSKDGKTLTLTLRRDAKFHDGSPVNAAAVKASLERAKTVQGSVVAQYLTSITSIDVVNDYTVNLKLVEGTGAELPAVFATTTGSVINPATFSADLGANPPSAAGSGPYTFTRISLPQQVTLTRAGKHWDPNAGKAKELQIIFPNNSANALNAVRSGQLDIAQISIDGMAEAKRVVKEGAIGGREFFTNTLTNLTLNPQKPPFDRLEVRQAVASAVDRKLLADKLFGGNCLPTAQPMPVGHWAYDAKMVDAFPYNPARTRAILAKLGGEPPVVSIAYGTYIWFPAQAEATQGMLSDAGFKVEMEPLAPSATVQRYLAGNWASRIYALAGQADPAFTMTHDYVGTGGWNLAKGTPVEGKMNELAKKALDPRLTQAQRASLYGEMAHLINEYVLDIPICAVGNIWVYNKKLMNTDKLPFAWAAHIDGRYLVMAK